MTNYGNKYEIFIDGKTLNLFNFILGFLKRFPRGGGILIHSHIRR